VFTHRSSGVDSACKWSRNPKTVECNFKRITAKFISEGPLSGQVSTEVSTKREVITVASASESEKAGDVGFIGEGFTKCGIYVCLLFLDCQVIIIKSSKVSCKMCNGE
jgi:hypothetical protein